MVSQICNRRKQVKRKRLAGMLGLFLMIRIFPAFSIFWSEHIALPALKILSGIGKHFLFALLEWAVGAACVMLLISFFRRRLLQTLFSLGTAVLFICLTVWYPLYFLPQPVYTSTPQEISTLCEALIDDLNAYEDEFLVPNDLPAKFIRFPKWMDMLRISGFCSFLTGEALVSPELETISQPFVAVHEYMHLQGFAGEGAANIAAWEECIRRGGTYARSAQVWALRYGMGILRRDATALYEANMLRMNHDALQIYREAGGAYLPVAPSAFLRRLYEVLGIETTLQDYEILAPRVAAKYTG